MFLFLPHCIPTRNGFSSLSGIIENVLCMHMHRLYEKKVYEQGQQCRPNVDLTPREHSRDLKIYDSGPKSR